MKLLFVHCRLVRLLILLTTRWLVVHRNSFFIDSNDTTEIGNPRNDSHGERKHIKPQILQWFAAGARNNVKQQLENVVACSREWIKEVSGFKKGKHLFFIRRFLESDKFAQSGSVDILQARQIRFKLHFRPLKSPWDELLPQRTVYSKDKMRFKLRLPFSSSPTRVFIIFLHVLAHYRLVEWGETFMSVMWRDNSRQ